MLGIAVVQTSPTFRATHSWGESFSRQPLMTSSLLRHDDKSSASFDRSGGTFVKMIQTELAKDTNELISKELQPHKSRLHEILRQPWLPVVGPPGCGKTSFSTALVRLFVSLVSPERIKSECVIIVLTSWTQLATQVLTAACMKRLKNKKEVRLFMLGDEWMDFCSKYENASVVNMKDVEAWKKAVKEPGVLIVSGTVGKFSYVAGSEWTENTTLHGRVLFSIVDEGSTILETNALTLPRYFVDSPESDGVHSYIADNYQLPAFQQSSKPVHTGIYNLIHNHKCLLLDQQFRQPGNLNAFANHLFYGGLLKSAPHLANATDQSLHVIVWYSSKLLPYQIRRSTMEAEIIAYLSRAYAPNASIITGYLGQTQEIKQQFRKDQKKPSISTIDVFQGKEEDEIIMGLGRHINLKDMSDRSHIGFIGDRRRINVGLTRCKKNCILLRITASWMDPVSVRAANSGTGFLICSID